MTKKPTQKTLIEALTKIKNMDLGVSKEELLDMSSKDALDMVVTIADEALNPVEKPSAMELKTKEITDFIMKDFKLAFAPNDDIATALNNVGILSPNGKPWSRTNISKIMVGVREQIVVAVGGSNSETADTEPAPETPVEAPSIQNTPVAEEEPRVAEIAAQPASEPIADKPYVPDMTPTAEVVEKSTPESEIEDALAAELAELDELVG